MIVGRRVRGGGRAPLRVALVLRRLCRRAGRPDRRHPRPADVLAAPARHRRSARAHGGGRQRRGRPRAQPEDRHWTVHVHGKSHSWIPFGGIHSRLGAAPAMIHPAPVDVAIIGLGSGDTAWASASRPETRSLTVFEISGPQPKLLRQLAAEARVPRAVAAAERPAPPHPGRGRAHRARAGGRPVRRHRGRRAVADRALRGQPVLGRVLQPVHAAAEAGRDPLHLGPHAACLLVVHPGRAVHRRAGRPQRAVRQQRAHRDRPRAVARARPFTRGEGLSRARKAPRARRGCSTASSSCTASAGASCRSNMNFDLFPRDEFHSPN